MNETSTHQGVKMRKKILQAIITYTEEHGYPPSYREIGDMVGLRSNSSVYNHIHTMLEMGVLETDEKPGTCRALRVPGYKFVKEGKVQT